MKTTAWLVVKSAFRLTAKLAILWSTQVWAQPTHICLCVRGCVHVCTLHLSSVSYCVLLTCCAYVHICLWVSFLISAPTSLLVHVCRFMLPMLLVEGGSHQGTVSELKDAGTVVFSPHLTHWPDCSAHEIQIKDTKWQQFLGRENGNVCVCGHERDYSHCSQHRIYQFKQMHFILWTLHDVCWMNTWCYHSSLLFLVVIAHSDQLYRTSHRDDLGISINSACLSKMCL